MADSAYQGDEPYAFVCYAHEDSNVVYAEMAWLREQGINLWYDEGISAGTNWRAAIGDHLLGASHVLFYISKHSLTSDHCNREINLALDEGKAIVPVYLEDVELTSDLKVGLNRVQAIHRFEIDETEYRDKLSAALELSPSAPMDQPPPTKRQSWVAPLVALTLVVVVGTGGYILWPSGASEEPAKASLVAEKLHNSIAVLPFDNLSPDPDNAYFAAGVHEEILNQLAKIKDLSVIARTTMLRYADSDKSIPEIGDELNVSTVMEGSVRYAGNRVRITAQLIDAASGAHLWSEAYEEDLEDIFGIQLAIATRIADTLEAEFLPAEQQRVGHRATNNAEAYSYYLRALSTWGNLAATGSTHDALDAAISLDPEFAAALAFKGWIHAVEASFGGIFLGTAFTAEVQERLINLAQRLSRRALELDDSQARAHHALFSVYNHSRRWQAALDSTDRAYTLDPNDYIVANTKGWSMYWRKRDIKSAVTYLERSMELNPEAGNVWNVGEFFYFAERWEAAEDQAKLVIQLLPNVGLGYAQLALVSSRIGDVDAVHQNAELAEARNPGLYEFKSLALAFGQIGEPAEARRIFELAGAGNESEVPSLEWQFWMHMGVKDYDSAMSYLERAIRDNFPYAMAVFLHQNSDHPDLDPIRSHPKFDELVRQVEIPLDSSD